MGVIDSLADIGDKLASALPFKGNSGTIDRPFDQNTPANEREKAYISQIASLKVKLSQKDKKINELETEGQRVTTVDLLEDLKKKRDELLQVDEKLKELSIVDLYDSFKRDKKILVMTKEGIPLGYSTDYKIEHDFNSESKKVCIYYIDLRGEQKKLSAPNEQLLFHNYQYLPFHISCGIVWLNYYYHSTGGGLQLVPDVYTKTSESLKEEKVDKVLRDKDQLIQKLGDELQEKSVLSTKYAEQNKALSNRLETTQNLLKQQDVANSSFKTTIKDLTELSLSSRNDNAYLKQTIAYNEGKMSSMQQSLDALIAKITASDSALPTEKIMELLQELKLIATGKDTVVIRESEQSPENPVAQVIKSGEQS